MPDWFYRTISRPMLFALPPRQAQRFAVEFMSVVGRLPLGLGATFIDLLGHMHPPESLRASCGGTMIPGPVGLGHLVDPSGEAIRAWSRFGFGLIEVGPVSSETGNSNHLARNSATETITEGTPPLTLSAEDLALRLSELPAGVQTPLWIRLWIADHQTPLEAATCLDRSMETLRFKTAAFSVDRSAPAGGTHWQVNEWRQFWEALSKHRSTCTTAARIYWVLAPERLSLWNAVRDAALNAGVVGLVLESRADTRSTLTYGTRAVPEQLAAIREFRQGGDSNFGLIVSGGIHCPADALELLRAGADVALIDSGLIYSGPGLAKRINEAVLEHRSHASSTHDSTPAPGVFRCSWFWTLMLGVGMLTGGLMALWIASSKVVMPYDEVYCGLTRNQLVALNPKLLPFMAHDRVSLAGTMLTIGLLYAAFAWFGGRRGQHWSHVATQCSAGVGFFSFFLFLGFDYFDPFHAFVTAILFQLFIQALVGQQLPIVHHHAPELCETAEWRRGQWGQLLWVIHGLGLLAAGGIICTVGIGEVLVATDESFLGVSSTTIREIAPRVLPLVAHDRATLGGMLAAAGVLYLLASLWGVRRGEAWLWHTLVWGGILSYAPAIGVHFIVGYVEWIHLLPAFLGLGLLLIGALLNRRWMWGTAARQVADSR
ncbi:MAG: hypothetical protein JNN07_02280 [Verrucomicrobiales bacterium]|nr:hypothetical protein [Verrucomicrobiales bacterium]